MPKIPTTPKLKAKDLPYPEFLAEYHFGKNKLKVEKAKSVLGWEEVGAGAGKETVPLLTDVNGKKVVCVRNLGNRPFDFSLAMTYAQDILSGNWNYNGDTIIVGRSGRLISGQHRLIGLVLADQLRLKYKEHWGAIWKSVPSIEAVIHYGIQESPEVLRTVDNVRPRSFSDVLFTDPTFFADKADGERDRLAKAMDYAIKAMWRYTRASDDPYSGRKTHSEGVEFLLRHPRLKECLSLLWEENKDTKSITPFLPIGKASACLYLMASSATERGAYYDLPLRERSEEALDFERFDSASEFWVLLASGAPDFAPVKKAIDALKNPVTGEKANDVYHRAVLAKAWVAYVTKGEIDADDLELNLIPPEDGEGLGEIDHEPRFGGIDCGETDDDLETDADPVEDGEEEGADESEMSEEEQEAMGRDPIEEDAEEEEPQGFDPPLNGTHAQIRAEKEAAADRKYRSRNRRSKGGDDE